MMSLLDLVNVSSNEVPSPFNNWVGELFQVPICFVCSLEQPLIKKHKTRKIYYSGKPSHVLSSMKTNNISYL